MAASSRTLVEVLGDAQRVGTLGNRPIADVIEHARLFLPALAQVEGRVLDMGTGAGIPGLVIAEARPDLTLVLVDRRQTRIDALQRAIASLGWSDRVVAVADDVLQLGKRSEYRHSCGAVVCRGFGPPYETLVSARPFLSLGGILVVSEPPIRDENRWPADVLAELGFSEPQYLQGIAVFHVEQLPQ